MIVVTDMVIHEQDEPEVEPVQVSAQAHAALGRYIREWSGWPDAGLVLGRPESSSDIASCDHSTRTFHVNPDRLVLNPNRVLTTVTPFRLRQEAVLAGAMLHEAGHARFSRWRPRNDEDAKTFVHSDGTPVAPPTIALATLMEEGRIEGRMVATAGEHGAGDLIWTMRAAAAHLLTPANTLSQDPDQQIMDLLTAWALRAGRQYAISAAVPDFTPRRWVARLTDLLHGSIIRHLDRLHGEDQINHAVAATNILRYLETMVTSQDDTGTTLVDLARDVLLTLFPGFEDDAIPVPVQTCMSGQGESGDEGEGGGVSGNEGEGESAGEGEGETEEQRQQRERVEAALGEASRADRAEQREQAQAGTPTGGEPGEGAAPQRSAGGASGGSGSGGLPRGGWRWPTAGERDVQRQAERFLRGLVAPTETSKTSITDSPSAQVDGAALSAWRAAGGTRDPRFFRRTTRTVDDAPPVRIAIMVDVSGSMDALQAPSALLSWALASAAFDLRNFAGRGRKVESCLIHWGDRAETIQRNGQVLPGIREVPCFQGTSGMHLALDLVAEEMPGFFDVPEDGRDEHRLLVQFTDWELFGRSVAETEARLTKALHAGVNMLSVVPGGYNPSASALGRILSKALRQSSAVRGRSTLFRYDPARPERVWGEASKSIT